MQPEEEKYSVKQVLKGQNVMDTNASYTLVQDLQSSKALTAFNNKQAMFNKQSQESLEHCLSTVTAKVLPNKAYKLQKRVINLNNYLEEFTTPTGIVAKKLEDDEILEVLENRVPTS
eukprot:15362600-Ditylum_brightwellii.AAC.1